MGSGEMCARVCVLSRERERAVWCSLLTRITIVIPRHYRYGVGARVVG